SLSGSQPQGPGQAAGRTAPYRRRFQEDFPGVIDHPRAAQPADQGGPEKRSAVLHDPCPAPGAKQNGGDAQHVRGESPEKAGVMGFRGERPDRNAGPGAAQGSQGSIAKNAGPVSQSAERGGDLVAPVIGSEVGQYEDQDFPAGVQKAPRDRVVMQGKLAMFGRSRRARRPGAGGLRIIIAT